MSENSVIKDVVVVLSGDKTMASIGVEGGSFKGKLNFFGRDENGFYLKNTDDEKFYFDTESVDDVVLMEDLLSVSVLEVTVVEKNSDCERYLINVDDRDMGISP